MSATSMAWYPRTSRKMNTARWRARQDLQSGDEGQRDGFGLLRSVPSGPSGMSIDTLEERVGIRLEPHDFTEPRRLGWFNLGHVPLLGRTSAGRAKRIETSVGGDPVEPGADRGAPLEVSQALPGGQQRLLQGVLGVLQGSEHPVAVRLQLSAVRFGQLAECVAVSGPRPGDQVGCHSPPTMTSVARCLGPSSIDTGRVANWARPVLSTSWCLHRNGSDDPGARDGDEQPAAGLLMRRRGNRAAQGASDDVERQGGGDLRSRRGRWRRSRARIRSRGREALSEWTEPSQG